MVFLNDEDRRAYQRKWYRKNKLKRNKENKQFRIKNKARLKLDKQKLRQTQRKQLFDILGSLKCVCNRAGCWHEGLCIVNEFKVLQFDHIEGGGVRETKEIGGSGKMVRYYIKNPEEARIRLQVLCANCNWLKRWLEDEFSKGKIK